MKNKRFDYFVAFATLSAKACRAAEMLEEFFGAFTAGRVPERMQAIHIVEHEADEIKHDIIEHLSHEFVSPLEREDIVDLVQELDNIVDSIDEVIRKVGMYRITCLRSDVPPFVQLLTKSCEAVNGIMNELSDFRKSKTVKEKIIGVNKLESEADTLHFNAISSLFAAAENPVAILSWQSIYDTLENCFDCCEHAADVIETVILKNT